MLIEHRIQTSDGVRLHVETAGAGPAVVFVAGYTASLATWAFQIDAVVAAGYRAVAIDRRWHGRSDRPAFGQRIARHAADIRDVVTALELDRPILVGASMGAAVCWSYIDIHGPNAVAGMVGIDQTPRMVNGKGWAFGLYGLEETNVGTFFSNGVPSTGRGRPAEASGAAIAALAERVAPATLADPITADTRALLDDHARQDWRDLCARTAVPMLLIAGRDSQLWPCEHAAAAVAGNPLGHFAVIEDCGHAANVDQPAAVNASLLSFLHAQDHGRRSKG
jgi:pimeloyl-ACP methyl ester carboxylesterase